MRLIGLGKHHKLLDGLVLDLVVVCFATKAERGFVHVDIETTSGGEMQNIQEGGNGIASRLANLSLVDERLIEEGSRIFDLLAVLAACVLTLRLLAGSGSGDVEAHLDELITASGGLGALCASATQLGVGTSVGGGGRGQGHLDSDLVSTGKVGVANVRVGQLKGRAVLDAKGELRFGELGLAPVPAAKGVFLVLEGGAVPVLEHLGKAVVVLLREAVQLNDAGASALEDLDLVTLRSAAPLRGRDVGVVEGEGVAAAGGLPAESRLGEPALAALLGEVQVDVVEALTAMNGSWLAGC